MTSQVYEVLCIDMPRFGDVQPPRRSFLWAIIRRGARLGITLVGMIATGREVTT